MEFGESLGIMTAIEIAVEMRIETEEQEKISAQGGRIFAAERLAS